MSDSNKEYPFNKNGWVGSDAWKEMSLEAVKLASIASVKARKEKQTKTIEQYSNDPKLCQQCNKPIQFKNRKNRFCSRSCAAFYNMARASPDRKYGPSSDPNSKNSIKKNKSRSNGPKKLTPDQKQQKYLNNLAKSKIKRALVVKTCHTCDNTVANKRKYCDICQPNLALYRVRAKFEFNIYEYPNEFDLHLAKQHGWYSPNGYKRRNKTPNLNGVSRDHLYTILDGFTNGRDPKLLAHPANCQIMLHNGPGGNNSKNNRSTITWEELLERIAIWDKKYPLKEL